MTPLENHSSSLPVAVDAMGGDYGPSVVVEGVIAASRELNIRSTLVGQQDILSECLKKFSADKDPNISIHHAPDAIVMEDSPSTAIRRKPNSSIRVAFQLVKDGTASSVISPGNTGAVMAAGIFVSGTLPGIVRPAIASLLPKVGDAKPLVLLDSGANVDCHAYQLIQFALMGHYYAKVAIGVERPRIALLSNGSEASKGTDVIRAAALSLSEMSELNFTGYAEAKDLPRDSVDVVVCDGFVGNVLLKAMEGSVELVVELIKQYAQRDVRARLGMWLAKPFIKRMFKEKLDPSAYGGAPLLGLNHIAIVCHGSSNARAIMNAIRIARTFASSKLVSKLEESLASLDLKTPGTYEDGLWDRVGQRFERMKGKRQKGNPAEETS